MAHFVRNLILFHFINSTSVFKCPVLSLSFEARMGHLFSALFLMGCISLLGLMMTGKKQTRAKHTHKKQIMYNPTNG